MKRASSSWNGASCSPGSSGASCLAVRWTSWLLTSCIRMCENASATRVGRCSSRGSTSGVVGRGGSRRCTWKYIFSSYSMYECWDHKVGLANVAVNLSAAERSDRKCVCNCVHEQPQQRLKTRYIRKYKSHDHYDSFHHHHYDDVVFMIPPQKLSRPDAQLLRHSK